MPRPERIPPGVDELVAESANPKVVSFVLVQVRSIPEKLGLDGKALVVGAVAVLFVLALALPAAAQSRKKTGKRVAPRPVEVVSEANTPETPKPVVAPAASPFTAGTTGGYRDSLQDLVTLREAELADATAQNEKMLGLARDGLVSKKAVDESADAIVEARAKLADAKMRLAAFDGTPMTAETDPDADLAVTATTSSDTDHASAPAATGTQPALKKTSIVHPRRRNSSRSKNH